MTHLHPVSYQRIASRKELIVLETQKENELNDMRNICWNLPNTSCMTESGELQRPKQWDLMKLLLRGQYTQNGSRQH